MIVTTAKGRSIETSLSFDESLAICATLKSSFAQDLVRKATRLSSEQMKWVFILAAESAVPAQSPQAQASVAISAACMKKIISLFTMASASLKYPKVRLMTPAGKIALIYNAHKSRINVTDGGTFGSNVYYGAILCSTQEFRASGNCTPDVIKAIAEFQADPAGVAQKYGQATGNCCFCEKDLTDAESVARGYGKICARNFNLPYGGLTKSAIEIDLFAEASN